MKYVVKAIDTDMQPITLRLEATSADEAHAQALILGYSPLSVGAARIWRRVAGTSKTRFPLIQFSQELLALLSAGLALVEAIETLGEKELRPEFKRIFDKLLARLHEGHSFATSLEKTGADLDSLYIASVRASEKTGALSESLARYVVYQSQVDDIKKQVSSALIYPSILAATGSVVTIFLLAYVVPRFAKVYSEIGGDLPWSSRALIAWGDLVNQHGTVLAIGSILALTGAIYLTKSPFLRTSLFRTLCRFPAIGRRIQVFYLSRFYRATGMLLRGGLPVVTALDMVTTLLTTAMQAQLIQALTHIRHGRSVSDAMESVSLTTPVALRMLRVGERTGDMGEMMDRIAAFYEEETTRWITRFTKLFEPLLMMVIGLIVGGIVVLMYIPIFDLAGTIQ